MVESRLDFDTNIDIIASSSTVRPNIILMAISQDGSWNGMAHSLQLGGTMIPPPPPGYRKPTIAG